jgi:Flp pilus assembly pilin Flp
MVEPMPRPDPLRPVAPSLRTDNSAATAIEYAMIASLVSIVGFVLYINIGSSVAGMFASIAGGF